MTRKDMEDKILLVMHILLRNKERVYKVSKVFPHMNVYQVYFALKKIDANDKRKATISTSTTQSA